ncbi:MAG: hypothetical protein IJB17_03075 [Oscillospiraceae bacterium]|nr:hypothetical protein [Oscillospiraceae bacterium]
MKQMKRIFAAVFALCVMLSLCACSGGSGSETTAPVETTVPIETTAPVETTAPQQGGYTVKLVDEGGNPVPGGMVQICLDACMPTMVDANGVATWQVEPAEGYKVSFLKLPDGYTYVDEAVTEFYFGSGETEMTITLKAVA